MHSFHSDFVNRGRTGRKRGDCRQSSQSVLAVLSRDNQFVVLIFRLKWNQLQSLLLYIKEPSRNWINCRDKSCRNSHKSMVSLLRLRYLHCIPDGVNSLRLLLLLRSYWNKSLRRQKWLRTSIKWISLLWLLWVCLLLRFVIRLKPRSFVESTRSHSRSPQFGRYGFPDFFFFSNLGKKITPADLYAHIEQGCIPSNTTSLLLSGNFRNWLQFTVRLFSFVGNVLRDEGIPIVLSCFNFLTITSLDLEGALLLLSRVFTLKEISLPMPAWPICFRVCSLILHWRNSRWLKTCSISVPCSPSCSITITC
jgi:hypothetical protein